MKKYDAIIFDVDGTLIDSFPKYKAIMEIIMPKYGIDQISEKDLKITFPLTADQTLKHLGISEKLTNQMINDYLMTEAKLKMKPVLFSGLTNFFKVVAKQYPDVGLGIVTSGSNRDIAKLKDNFSFMNQIWTTVTSDTLPYHKPAPEPLIEAISEMGFKRQQALYIGDAYTDEGCAKNAQVDFGLAGWGEIDSKLKNGYADYDFKTPDQIISYLNN